MFRQRITVWLEVSLGKGGLSGCFVFLILSQVPGFH